MDLISWISNLDFGDEEAEFAQPTIRTSLARPNVSEG